MRRAFVFLLLAPVSVATIWTIYGTMDQVPRGLVEFLAFCLFVFTFLVAAPAALADSLLARTLPALVRATLVATVGAAIPVSAWLAVEGSMLPPFFLTPLGIGGALCMGVCSLLSHNYQSQTA